MRKLLVHQDWGIEGLRYALDQGDLVVVVDALRFSSAVVTAIAHGFTIYPVSSQKRGRQLARTHGAELAGKPHRTRYSLSPLSYLAASAHDNKNVVLFSPNGAACAEAVRGNDRAYIGCLLNARAVGKYISKRARETGHNVTLIAAGEQQAIDTGERIVYVKRNARRVFALEDYVACGAVSHYSTLARSAEAELCTLSYGAARKRLLALLRKSFSGRYLIQHNLGEDVVHAAQENRYNVVPVIRDGKIVNVRDAVGFQEKAKKHTR